MTILLTATVMLASTTFASVAMNIVLVYAAYQLYRKLILEEMVAQGWKAEYVTLLKCSVAHEDIVCRWKNLHEYMMSEYHEQHQTLLKEMDRRIEAESISSHWAELAFKAKDVVGMYISDPTPAEA